MWPVSCFLLLKSKHPYLESQNVLTVTVKVCDVNCEYFWQDWPCYNEASAIPIQWSANEYFVITLKKHISGGLISISTLEGRKDNQQIDSSLKKTLDQLTTIA